MSPGQNGYLSSQDGNSERPRSIRSQFNNDDIRLFYTLADEVSAAVFEQLRPAGSATGHIDRSSVMSMLSRRQRLIQLTGAVSGSSARIKRDRLPSAE